MLGWLVSLALSAEPDATDAPGTAPATDAPSSPAPSIQPGLMPANAPTPSPAPGPSASSPSHRRIDAAISLYLAGDTVQARRILQGVLVDSETLAPQDRQDALAWLGDIQFAEQGAAAAQSVLASLLAENADYVMDPLVHPPDFCDAFERLRAEVRRLPAVRQQHPYPWQLGLPLGVGYFIEGEPLPGVVFGTLQVGGIVTSIVTRVEMTRMVNSEDGLEHEDTEAIHHFTFLRALNGTSSSVAWAAWGVPFVFETARWSVSRGAPQVTMLELRADGVAISGRF